jgi:hypothetical protein
MIRLPRVQFTLRRLMVTLAVLGISLGRVLEEKGIWRRLRDFAAPCEVEPAGLKSTI